MKLKLISNENWMIGNKAKHQTQLDTHFWFINPMQNKIYGAKNKMANIKECAENYIAKETKNIAELERVSVDLEIENKVVNQGESNEWNYDFVTIDEEEYKVNQTVLKQLKVQLEANPSLLFFKVSKEGEGLKTAYTVIPLLE